MKEHYDYLVVGCGLFGSVVANRIIKNGYSCLIIDKRNHIGGNVYDEEIEGINVHKYGPHIFHTSYEDVWKYITSFDEFLPYINSPLAKYNDIVVNMPFNMNTFNKLWGITNPQEAKDKIESEKTHFNSIENLEQQAISMVGLEIYEMFIKGYTEKQWGKSCNELSPNIIKRIPLRFTFNNNYFTDKYQGLPKHGYTRLIEKMVEGCDILLNTDFFENKHLLDICEKVVYSGKIDEYYGYKYGRLDYRSTKFEFVHYIGTSNMQGNAVINHTSNNVPYTRTTEYKHFPYKDNSQLNIEHTFIGTETPIHEINEGEPLYPIDDEKNREMYAKYEELANSETNVIFGGRLGSYKYYDMDDVVRQALYVDLKQEIPKIKIWVSYHDESLIEEYNLKNTSVRQLFNCKRTDYKETNINHLNDYFCELCTMWYVWKNNKKSEYVGFEHYRRNFDMDDNTLLDSLSENSCLVHEIVSVDTLCQNYVSFHNEFILATDEYWRLKYGNKNVYSKILFSSSTLIVGNVIIYPWELFKKAMEFLFDSLDGTCKMLGIDMFSFEENRKLIMSHMQDFTNRPDYEYQKRWLGFLGERILTIWLQGNGQ